jgi:hypothetical protein
MNRTFLSVALIVAVLIPARAADDSAIVDGPNYAFTISAPKGWKLTSNRQFQAAFYPADSTFEKSAVIIYARSADKSELHVSSIAELNRLDLKGIQEREPAAKSEKLGALKTASGVEMPLYSFSGGGYSELVAYAEQSKTITVLVVSAETPEQLKAARSAFDELVGSYVFISDAPKKPKKAVPSGK